jgi:hypothetical protein
MQAAVPNANATSLFQNTTDVASSSTISSLNFQYLVAILASQQSLNPKGYDSNGAVLVHVLAWSEGDVDRHGLD